MKKTILAAILLLALAPLQVRALDFTYSAPLPVLSEGNFLDELNTILSLPTTVQGSVTGLNPSDATDFASATSNIDSVASAVPTFYFASTDMLTLTSVQGWEFSTSSGTIGVQLYFDTNPNTNGCSVTTGWCIFGTDADDMLFDVAVEVDATSSVVPTPTPATLALLGLGLLGVGYRRRQHKVG